MTRQAQIIVGIIVVVLVGGLVLFGASKLISKKEVTLSTKSFSCDGDKTIQASFYADRADVVLSDGRTLSLPEMTSAAGVRYATKDDNLVFTQQGDKAAIAEGRDGNITYQNCEVLVPGQEARSTYASTTLGVTIRYPKNYSLNTAYAYDRVSAKKLIAGVKLSIPDTIATGTNLMPDSGVSIESLPHAKSCTGDIYLKANVKAHKVTEAGVDYSVASSTQTVKGDIYDEVVYALVTHSPCVAVRYFIHSTKSSATSTTVLQQFDRDALVQQFDKIRQSLVLAN